ncbi:heavy metal-binding domain-containing protein [Acidocella facilis]|uniref:heavy metal-binding domain-containing protein n=1 Tax=Acidocella facilis TaxID=525 RepID=UPI00068AD0C8|nr:heavy metal-binding domain-containing protein [Acidocella facilis]
MGLFDFIKGKTADQKQAEAQSARRQADILNSVQTGRIPRDTLARLTETVEGRKPWMATLTPAELRLARSHGLKPIAAISATCWLHYGWSWTLGHAQGWETALKRLADEARACGANAVLDVKMRTIPLDVDSSMDFSLTGTAVKLEGLPPSNDPIIATVPALEFVKLLEADVVPTGIAIGAHYEWLRDWRGYAANPSLWFNVEASQLSGLWEIVRRKAHANLRETARPRGNGVLAHVNFSQIFEVERDYGQQKIKEYLARHIVVATTVDARRGTKLPHDVVMMVDMRDGFSPLTGTAAHHQSYATNQTDGAI